MISNPRVRRRVSYGLMAAGGILLWLAPENAWMGVTALVVGVVLETIGVRIGHPG